ncbi:hypothetical protein GCM10007079_20890 [Nocardiopsis terrae]|nr:hypothetical protein GCM10007079_20890 [Nocardiopsis terrae]
MTPTEAGVAFARHAADVLSGLDAAVREVSALRQHITGCVTIGAIPAAAAALVPRALAQMADEHPPCDRRLRGGFNPQPFAAATFQPSGHCRRGCVRRAAGA